MKKLITILAALAIAYFIGYESFWVWIVENVDVPADTMLVLVAKTGTEMPPGQIIAAPGQKGVLQEPLGSGRHFINPFLYERQLKNQIVIKSGEVGLVIAKSGKELAAGEFLAGPGEQGIQRDMLLPGTYKLNPYAFDVKIMKMIEIDPGYVGVVTARSGKTAQGLLAEPGERGVQKAVLPPGLYPINPEAYSVERVEIGYNQITMAHAGKIATYNITGGEGSSQQLAKQLGEGAPQQKDKFNTAYPGAMNGPAQAGTKAVLARQLGQGAPPSQVPTSQTASPVLPAVTFPSTDGFDITIDVTLLWQLLPQDAPSVYARYGNLEKIEQNILIPQINSTARIKGSTFGAVDFIVGDKREEFQRAFQETIEATLHEKKLQVDLALVQDTLVPETISGPIQDARIASEWNVTNTEKTKTEAKKAELDEMTGRIRQVEQIVEFETQRREGNIRAAQEKEVTEIAAQTRLLVADFARQTAEIRANVRRKLGAADAKVVELKGQAEGDGFTKLVQAAGSSRDYTDYQFALQLPAKLRLALIYAGPGTLWTDLQKASDIAPLGVLKELKDKTK
ncbi:MAG: SPFH domain-containing protein [Verrucomicrobiota bacterium]